MLTKIDIDSHYYKLHKHLINTEEGPISSNSLLHVLFDPEYRIIALSEHFMSIKALATFDKNCVYSLGLRSNQGKIPTEFFIKRSECWKYKINSTDTAWEENYNINSIERLNDYILTNQKSFYLDKLHNTLKFYRMKNVNDDEFQQYIYSSKYLEAKEILEKNIENDDLLQYPYTTGYANLNGLELQQAAKSIKIQYEIQSGFLSESENLRLKYKSLIVNETDISKLKSHFNSFVVENDIYGAI